jgi:hypothetical protein
MIRQQEQDDPIRHRNRETHYHGSCAHVIGGVFGPMLRSACLLAAWTDRWENWAWEWTPWQTSYAMKTLGKVLQAILVGVAALIIGEFALGFLFGVLNGAFGWPIPTSTTRNIILLTLFVIGLFIYKQRHSPKP